MKLIVDEIQKEICPAVPKHHFEVTVNGSYVSNYISVSLRSFSEGVQLDDQVTNQGSNA
jgi:hypothetical protein